MQVWQWNNIVKKIMISIRYKCALMSNLYKKSWTVSNKGVITSKDDLPIVAFKYGPYSLGGYHPEIRIGKLKCQGKVQS